MLKSAPRYGPANEQGLMGYLAGELTERVVSVKLSAILGSRYTLIDGHEPFTAPNFGEYRGMTPKNLDVVQIDARTGDVAAIYEVKSTTTDKAEFEVNGQSGIFMTHAAELGIPTFLVVVRIDRSISDDILRKELATGKVDINPKVYLSEVNHLLETSRIELYGSDQFRVEGRKFLVSGVPKTLESCHY